jgi:hypothetical protein
MFLYSIKSFKRITLGGNVPKRLASEQLIGMINNDHLYPVAVHQEA